MAVKRDTKNQILDIAEALLQERGFHAFSYQHIASKLGVKNAAIHYHYPSKNDLAVALVARYRRRFSRWSENLAKENAAPWPCFESYIETCRYLIESNKICVLGMMAAEFNTMAEEVQREIQLLQDEVVSYFSDLLKRGQEQGEFSFLGDAAHKALVLTCQLQGAMQFAQVKGSGVYNVVVDQLRAELKPQA
ncbi:MAG: TetR/AcrR family transcriptional regulator [Planctomycetota bacterium]|nr:TetR/AcrR family transcriptional regulator [Planctomycetota bacterium]